MATGPPDGMTNQDPAEVTEESPAGKKKSKFQTFKNFFAKKKRKEAAAPAGDAGLKASQSTDNVNTPETPDLTRSDNDQGSGSKINMGGKALSHESVFVSDSPLSEEKAGLAASQDSAPGKVKSLQLQLKQAIRLGSPPSLMCVRKMEDGGALSEDDGLPCSPPEFSTPHIVLAGGSHQRNSSLSQEGTDSDDDQLSGDLGSRPVSPLVILPVDFSQPASPMGCLDNAAAKHRLAVRHHACNKRKPTSRLEVRPEGEDQQDQTVLPESIEDRQEDQGEEEEEEEDEDEDVDRAPAHPSAADEGAEDEQTDSKQSQRVSGEQPPPPRSDKDDERGAVQEDVSHVRDDSSSPSPSPVPPGESGVEECQLADLRPGSGSASPPSSRSSSLGCLASLEPPAGDFLLEAGGAGQGGEEESSLLQEVLSSLRGGPLSSSLGLDMDEGALMVGEKEEEGRGVASGSRRSGREEGRV